jgi:putative monooxygenase
VDAAQARITAIEDGPADTRRGGEIRVLLGPKTVGATSGFMGVAKIGPGDKISEHYHPYSEEFIYVVDGTIVARLDGAEHEVSSGHGLFIPPNVRHRLMNRSDSESFIVFHLGPLAPRPDLGHVDTE